MYSDSLREFARSVAVELGQPDISEEQIDEIMFSWGFTIDQRVKP